VFCIIIDIADKTCDIMSVLSSVHAHLAIVNSGMIIKVKLHDKV